MLLGLQIVRQLRGTDQDYVHYAIYSASSIIGFIIMIAALFNIYSINYQKSEQVLAESPTLSLSTNLWVGLFAVPGVKSWLTYSCLIQDTPGQRMTLV